MKNKLLLVYVFIAFIVLCTNVYAVVTMDLSLVTDKSDVEPGSDLLVTVNLKNISAPISSIEGYINVDENVIEAISEDIIVSTDGKIEVKSENSVVNKLSYAFNPSTTNADYDVIFNTKKENIDNNDCFFVMDLSRDIEQTADILPLKLKIKDNATIKTVSEAIKVDCVVAYSAETGDTTEEISAALDIKVVKDANTDNNNDENEADNANAGEDNSDENENTETNENTNTNDDTNTNEDKNENTNTNDNTNTNENKNTNTNNNTNKNTNKNATNTNTNSNSSTDTTVAGTTIPKAGSFLIIIPIVVFAVLAYVSYNRYIKYKDI